MASVVVAMVIEVGNDFSSVWSITTSLINVLEGLKDGTTMFVGRAMVVSLNN